MKVAIPLNSLGDLQAKDFSSCSFFGVYNLQTNELKKFSEKDLTDFYPGDSLTEIFQKMKIESVISPAYSGMMINLFHKNNIKAFQSVGYSIYSNIEMLKNELLADASASLGDGCGSSCGTCSSKSCNN